MMQPVVTLPAVDFFPCRTLIKQGPYGRKPVVKRAIVVTPGSLVKVYG